MEKQESLAPHETESPSGSTEVGQSLSRLLATTQKLCRQSLYCHWQAEEPDFDGLHSLFEHHYQSLRKAGDILSARLSALNCPLPSQYSSHSAWGTDPNDARPPEEMIRSLLRSHQACAQEAKKLTRLADATGDDETATLASQRYGVHDRAALLLLALLQAKTPIRSVV